MRARNRLLPALVILAAAVSLSGLAEAQTQSQTETRTPTRQPSTSPTPPPVETLETLRRFPPVGQRTEPLPGPRARPYDAERSTTPGAAPAPQRSFAPKLAPVPYDPRGERQPVVKPAAKPSRSPTAAAPKAAAPKRAERSAPAGKPAAEPPPAAPAPPPVVTAAVPAPPPPSPPVAKPAPFPFLAAGLGGLALLVILAVIAALARRMMAGGGAAATFSTRVSVNPGQVLEPEFAGGPPGPAFAFRVRPGSFTSEADYPVDHPQAAGAVA